MKMKLRNLKQNSLGAIMFRLGVLYFVVFAMSAEASTPSKEFQDDWKRLSLVLKDSSISPEWRDSDGYSIVLLQLRYGSEDVAVDFLRRAKSNKVWAEPGGARLMSIAAEMGSQQVVKALLARHEPPNGIASEAALPFGSPLMGAAWAGRLGVMRMLIEAGADVNYSTSGGTTALRLALSRGKNRAARLLIEAGANLESYRKEQRNSDLIFLAINGGSADAIMALIEQGFDLNVPRLEGETVLTHAVRIVADRNLVEELIARGANPCVENNVGETPEKIIEKSNDLSSEDRKHEYGSMFEGKCN